MADPMRRGQIDAQPAYSTPGRWAILKQLIRLLHDDRLSLHELLSRLAELLPGAFGRPEIVHARVTLDSQSFCSLHFQETPRMRQVPFIAPDGHQGSIELAHRHNVDAVRAEEPPESVEGPEETAYLEVIAELLKGYLGSRVENNAQTLELADRQRLEQQLRQAQKMEVVGRLAGGVAHDFNNLLTVISGYSEILLENMNSDDPAREIVKEIYRSGERASLLTQQLLAFSRKQMLEPKVLNLNDVVLESSKMLGRLIGEDIRLRTVLAEHLHLIRVDPGQLEQVIMNLAINSRDAMPDGGELEITFRKRDDRIATSFRDSGMGISAEHLPRILEPMFSTKARGIGLGLPLARSILEKHDGKLEVMSQPGQGSTFVVWLPAAPAENADSTSAFTS